MVWEFIVLVVILFQVGSILFIEYRHPDKALAWLTIMLVLPVIGFMMYYFLTRGYRQKRKLKARASVVLRERHNGKRNGRNRDQASEEGMFGGKRRPVEKDARLLGILQHLPDSSLSGCNKVELYNNGKDTYEAILLAMQQAKHHIHMEYYTMRGDETGRKFQELMIRKAQEGVEVRLLVDGIGSLKIGKRFVRELEAAGVETGCFLPPFIALIDKRMNYRNHRKIVVVDGLVGFLGGVNIGEEYIGRNPELGYWRDSHLRLEGDAVAHLQYTFCKDWYLAAEKKLEGPPYYPQHNCKGSQAVAIVNSGPDSQADAILELYFSAVVSAQHKLYLTTPYFIPEQGMTLAMKTAAISGVDTRLLLPGIADSPIVFRASMSYVEDLLQAGVKVYLYQKGFIHAKVLMVDDKLASIGSANMDMRSFFSNFEQNAVLLNEEKILQVERDFLQDLANSRELLLEDFVKRSRWQRRKEMLARLVSPLF